jgi:hypothetical protein
MSALWSSVKGAIGRGEGSTWSAVIELRRGSGQSLGTRTLATTAPDCSSLDDSLALATGLMVDVSQKKLADERATESAAPAAVRATPIVIPHDTPPARARVRVETALGAEALLGLFPGVVGAGWVGVALEPPRFFRVELDGELSLEDDERDASGRGGKFRLAAAVLDVCPITHRSVSFAVHGCVTQRFGAVTAHGVGFDDSMTATEPLWTIGARVIGTLSIAGPVAIRLGIGGDVPLVRYRFVYSDASGDTRTVRKMAAGAGSAELGLAVAW